MSVKSAFALSSASASTEGAIIDWSIQVLELSLKETDRIPARHAGVEVAPGDREQVC